MNRTNDKAADHSNTRTFLAVFVALCVLTLISVAIATVEIFPNRAATWTAFLGVAFLKAALVVFFFMHLKWEKVWKYYLTMPALVLGLVLAVSLIPDIGWRSDAYSQPRIEAGPDLEVAPSDNGEPKNE